MREGNEGAEGWPRQGTGVRLDETAWQRREGGAAATREWVTAEGGGGRLMMMVGKGTCGRGQAAEGIPLWVRLSREDRAVGKKTWRRVQKKGGWGALT